MGATRLHNLTLEAELLTKIVNRLDILEVKLDMALKHPVASKPVQRPSLPPVSNTAQSSN